MNKLLTSIAIACVLGASTTLAFAATDEAPIEVNGHVSPGACDVSLGGDGEANYGQIDPNTLSNAAANSLGTIPIDIEIQCSSPTQLALMALDNRSSTEDGANGIYNLLGTGNTNTFLYGLGTDALGVNLGAYRIQLQKAGLLVNGTAPANFILSDNDGSTWTVTGLTQATFSHVTQRLVSWASAASPSSPIATTNLTGKLAILAAIKPTSVIAASRGFDLDGNATLEVVYL